MNRQRTLGIKIVAMIFFIDSAILLICGLAQVFLSPDAFAGIVRFVGQVPYFKNLPIGPDPFNIILDVGLGLWAAVKGVSVWLLKSWVRNLIIFDLTCRSGSFLFAAELMDRKSLHDLLSNPDFVVGAVINLCVLVYLLNAETERAFDRERA